MTGNHRVRSKKKKTDKNIANPFETAYGTKARRKKRKKNEKPRANTRPFYQTIEIAGRAKLNITRYDKDVVRCSTTRTTRTTYVCKIDRNNIVLVLTTVVWWRSIAYEMICAVCARCNSSPCSRDPPQRPRVRRRLTCRRGPPERFTWWRPAGARSFRPYYDGRREPFPKRGKRPRTNGMARNARALSSRTPPPPPGSTATFTRGPVAYARCPPFV